MNNNLDKLREQWEDGYEVIGVRNSHASGEMNVALIRDTQFGPEYRVHRYFWIGGNWHVSADLTTDNGDEVIKHLLEVL